MMSVRSRPLAAAVCAAAALALGFSSANATVFTFNFPLTVDQTNPAAVIPMGDPEPTGFATVMVDDVANTISYDITYEDLTGDIVSPGGHFHGPAPLGMNAGVELFFAGGSSNAPLPQPASGNIADMDVSITPAQVQDVLAGLWYINIHTTANPNGELRGQVVPEPATMALIGLGGLTLLRRRRGS